MRSYQFGLEIFTFQEIEKGMSFDKIYTYNSEGIENNK